MHLSTICSGRESEATWGQGVKDVTLLGVVQAFGGNEAAASNKEEIHTFSHVVSS